MRLHTRLLLLLLLLPLTSLVSRAQQEDGNIYFFSGGQMAYKCAADAIDSIALTSNNSMLEVYDTAHVMVYKIARTNIDSITFNYQPPKPKLLDLEFLPDGTARDNGAYHLDVTRPVSNGMYVYYNNTYQCYACRFSNSWGNNPSGCFKANYENVDAVKSGMADGHSFEVIVIPDYGTVLADVEAKPFSSHESGGSGLMVCKVSGSRGNEWTFLPYTNGSYRWATSGVKPVNKTAVHLIGVWDADKGKARIYVNGRLCNEVDAPGPYKHPKANSIWFGIGCDANTSTGGQSFCGDIVRAKVYNRVLSDYDIAQIWARVEELQKNAPDEIVSNVDMLNDVHAKAGASYDFAGSGFQTGDIVRLTEVGNTANSHDCEAIPLGNDSVKILLPASITSATYAAVLHRSGQQQDLGPLKLRIVSDKMPKAPLICAHRGYWQTAGSAQNSRTSLQKAIDLNVFSSEIDIWLTADDSMMVNHDASYGGVTIQTSTYEQCRNLTLSNGEKMPMFSDMLDLIRHSPHTLLNVEIKSHSTTARTTECAAKALQAIKDAGLVDKCHFCLFNYDAAKALKQMAPDMMVYYLNGDKDPETLQSVGLDLDYKYSVLAGKPAWIDKANEIGLRTAVWTVDSIAEMADMIDKGVEVIITNIPETMEHYRNYYLRHQND